MAKQSQQQQYDLQKKADTEARLNELMAKDWSIVDDIFAELSSAELKHLQRNCQSFKDAESRVETIVGFRKMTVEQQTEFFAACNESTRAILEKDGYVSSQTQTLTGSLGEAEALRDSQRAAEQARLFEENRTQVELAERETKLYPGVEIIGGKHRLVIDPGDGSSPEVFWGDSQKDVFQKLAESKRNATRELRRRAQKVRITAELRAITPEIIEYPPLVERVVLTPEQVYKYTTEQNDPVTSVEATRMLRLGGMTQVEVDRQNEIIVRSRTMEASSIVDQWMKETPEFYACPENIQAMIDLMGNEKGLNWACTKHNLGLAFAALTEQGVLVDRPAEEPEPSAFPQPTPRPPAFVPRAAAPAPAAPAAPQAQRPTVPLRRPTTHDPSQTSYARRTSAPIKAPMTAAEANELSATESKKKYLKDPNYAARLDAYWASGGR
jgi:hypothetical protein